VGTSVCASTHDVDQLVDRLYLRPGLCSMSMALSVPGAYCERGLYFRAAYCALQII